MEIQHKPSHFFSEFYQLYEPHYRNNSNKKTAKLPITFPFLEETARFPVHKNHLYTHVKDNMIEELQYQFQIFKIYMLVAYNQYCRK
jgi:hypothetical protein